MDWEPMQDNSKLTMASYGYCDPLGGGTMGPHYGPGAAKSRPGAAAFRGR